MIDYTELIGKKEFRAKNLKDAYMRAVKWYSTYIISNKKLKNITVEYVKDEKEKLITLYLYTKLDESEIKRRHCEICKATHKTFFINDQHNCASCNMMAYRKRVQSTAKVKKQYYSNIIKERTSLGGKNED